MQYVHEPERKALSAMHIMPYVENNAKGKMEYVVNIPER